MQVLAAIADKPGADFRIASIELSSPIGDEVHVRIAAVGLCHTDLAARDGMMGARFPIVLGHEGAGVIERIGPDAQGVEVGDVVLASFASCGHCARCQGDQPAYCRHTRKLNNAGKREDGTSPLSNVDGPLSACFFGQSSFAEIAVARAGNLVRLPPYTDPALAAPLACGVQTGAGAIFLALQCSPGTSLLVLGGGTVGLSAVMAAREAGCSTIVLSEPFEARRALALELGATHVIDPRETDVVAFVHSVTRDGADYALDSTGNDAAITAAIRSVRSRGEVGLTGLPHDPAKPLPVGVGEIFFRGVRVRGIIEGDSVPREFVPYLLDLQKAGRFPFDRLITRYPFAEINCAVADQLEGRCIKPVMLMSGQ